MIDIAVPVASTCPAALAGLAPAAAAGQHPAHAGDDGVAR
jgi:hypothetical protein